MRNVKNEEAVSPVIGVILMVVITVIIAAIMAVFAFGMGAPAKAPQTSIKATAVGLDGAVTNANTVTLEHQGGDELRMSEVKLVIEQEDSAGAVTRASYSTSGESTDKYVAGDKIVVSTDLANSPNIILNGDTANPLSIAAAAFAGDIIIDAGSTITVTVVDIPSGQIITKAKIKT